LNSLKFGRVLEMP